MSDSPAPTPTGPRVQRREAWVDLPKEYEGFKFRMWVNAPGSLWDSVWSGSDELIEKSLLQIMLEHNGWCDFDGKPYPPLSDPDFYKAVPTELVSCMLQVAQNETGKLPKSLARSKAR